MNKKRFPWFSTAAAMLACLFFASLFISYSQPMDNEVYDLSPLFEESEVSTIDKTAELGWTVFTQDGESVTELICDGLGCFEGLSHPGQTFYFSRVMREDLDAPTIQLDTSNRNFSVFLDGTLLYTDCPEQDNRIGHLMLPMREWDRKENITVSLPEDFVGKTLTIAQSTPAIAETPRMENRVIPTSVTLYCSYAYESALIAESFQTAIIGAISYVFGVLTIVLFLRKLYLKKFDWGVLFLALSIFLNMTAQIYDTSYYMQYFGIPVHISVSMLCRTMMIGSLLLFLCSGFHRLRALPWIIVGIYVISNTLSIALLNSFTISPSHQFMLRKISDVAGMTSLLIMLIISWMNRKYDFFHRYFAPLTIAFTLLWLLANALLPERTVFFSNLLNAIHTLTLQDSACHLAVIMISVAIAIVITQTVRNEVNLHTEKQLILEMSRLAQQRYENLRRYYEEVMMLRHDMNRHFQLLRQTTTDEKTAAYLDELIGQNSKIRPIIQTGNDLLDTILGSRLGIAVDSGVKLDIVRADAPASLPLFDSDLCSIVMNLLDNAIAGARLSQHPHIQLDLHRKSGFFIFTCENTTSKAAESREKEKTVPKHGLGLKIIHQIADRYGFPLNTQTSETSYKVSLAIPLGQSSK